LRNLAILTIERRMTHLQTATARKARANRMELAMLASSDVSPHVKQAIISAGARRNGNGSDSGSE
jgi:hypothetical protein